jgi:hypothetical protein
MAHGDADCDRASPTRSLWRALPAAGLCVTSLFAVPTGGAPLPLARSGPERLSLAYADPHAVEKSLLFEQINRERAGAGVPALRYDSRGAQVGDAFCLAAALAGSSGHFDVTGRAPYVRWGEAGGVDYQAENAAAYSDSAGRLAHPLGELLLMSHGGMMAERPPEDGHRRTILDPTFTHVGIGMAAVGGEFRMVEEFSRVGFEWVEVPAGPLPAGARAVFRGRPLRGKAIAQVELRHEPPLRSLSLAELRRRRHYAYPVVRRSLLPRPPPGLLYKDGSPGAFDVQRDGSFEVSFDLDAGPGFYFVVCLLRDEASRDGVLSPATSAMITALP